MNSLSTWTFAMGRRFLSGWLSAVVLLPLLLGAASSLEARSLEQIRKSGKLLVAIDPTYPPMEFEDSKGKPTGFDVALANAVATKLGVKAEFLPMNWDGILAGLTSDRYDMIMSSMNITPEREKAVAFVEYLRLAQVYVSPTTKGVTPIAKEADLAGKRVAVQADTTSMTAVEEAKKRGVKIKEIMALKLATDTFAAVLAGQADVIVTDEPVGHYYAKKDATKFVVSGQAIAPEPIGAAIRKEDKDLHAAVSEAVKGLRADGTFTKISMEWFGVDLSKPKAN